MKCVKLIFFMAFFAFTCIISQEITVNNTFAITSTCSFTGPLSSSEVTFSSLGCNFSDFTLNSSFYVKADLTYSTEPTTSICSNFLTIELRTFTSGSSPALPLSSSYLGNGWSTSSQYHFLVANHFVGFSGGVYTRYYERYSDTCYSILQSVEITFSNNLSDLVDLDCPEPELPTGSLSITENGTYDVTDYAEAVVDVSTSSGGGGGNYHEDLVKIYNAIMTCGAIALVLYFFYCIYRMIIKSTGGK